PDPDEFEDAVSPPEDAASVEEPHAPTPPAETRSAEPVLRTVAAVDAPPAEPREVGGSTVPTGSIDDANAAEVAPVAKAASPQPSGPVEQAPRRRGRPRGRPRRQVHFHVDPDEELLLLEAAKKHGSQQKGLIAALQALQDNDVLREEIERLRTECERQRRLLADAEA